MTDFRWKVVESDYALMPCPVCESKMDVLEVEPPRSALYANRILMCPKCKHIVR